MNFQILQARVGLPIIDHLPVVDQFQIFTGKIRELEGVEHCHWLYMFTEL